ncbi:DUF3284 domain-containing protein [Lacticaseibacillus pabuli]|uniref:DUF3284 domain-containing protein n=1 Tax=Lacticaseibacillus pabuli TaxID=3025672 RepID=A0ABY7WSM0_9LACO|nr:DUF3284 domain-containing protein [Lacticaseibacillus sp. KACC 23028]WDF82418.1 DUF3284 domain-containing protein [Lacticaseibacillus sp. KACC 23028]
MDIKMKLDVPAEYFFHRLIESALYDINEQTGKSLVAPQLPRFTYKKKLANGSVGHFTITDYQPTGVYAYAMHTGRNDYTVSYTVDKLEDNKAQLRYTENVSGASTTVNANNRLTSIMLGWFRKRRFKKMAAEIAKDYSKKLDLSQN